MTSVTLEEVHDLVAILRDAARTEIMPRFRGLVPMRTRRKSSRQDLVTDADEAAEAAITAACLERFPGVAIVGEEAVSKDPAVLGRLAEPGLAILVDPIDGTKNFASDVPCFGVMAAMVAGGEILAGVILDPVEDDVAIALSGEGAWRERADGRRVELRVSEPPATLREMAGTASWTFFEPPLRDSVPGRFPQLATASDYRCAAHQHRMLCAGHHDYALYGRPMPWDHAAGWLLHREAGGYAARIDGAPYDVTRHDGGLLYAPDRASFERLREALVGK